MQTDSELVARARRGDVRAFDALVRRHYGLARRIALGFTAVPEDADDLTQESFVAAFERLGQLANPERFAAWLATIARNNGRMWLRRRISQPTLCEFDEADTLVRSQISPVVTAAHEPMREAVADALAMLNAGHQRVVRMHYLQGYDYRETAELLHLSVSAVRGKLDRARDALRKELRHMATRDEGWELGSRDLAAMRAAATVAFSGEGKDAINTLLFDGEGRLVSSDTHRLMVYSGLALADIPTTLVHADLGRVLRDRHPDAARARLVLSANEAVLRLDGGQEVRVPLVDVQFPNWQCIVPAESALIATARAGDWLEALGLLRAQSESGFATPVQHRTFMKLSPEEGRITLRHGQEPDEAAGISREASVSFPAEFGGGGPDLLLAANSVYVEQAVSFLGVDADARVEFRHNTDLAPIMTCRAGGGDTYLVTMPMQRSPDPAPVEPAGLTH